eukprot:GHVU01189969.1.p1 GENE.GHVU01189969.1~~GHVU01189969.1.p1  ORF type:complete len:167 (+),score=15.94 GHVU01189969.1:87-587(+)
MYGFVNILSYALRWGAVYIAGSKVISLQFVVLVAAFSSLVAALLSLLAVSHGVLTATIAHEGPMIQRTLSRGFRTSLSTRTVDRAELGHAGGGGGAAEADSSPTSGGAMQRNKGINEFVTQTHPLRTLFPQARGSLPMLFGRRVSKHREALTRAQSVVMSLRSYGD